MSDLWLVAGGNAEAERHANYLLSARTAAAGPMAFVLGAADPDEYQHREALMAERLDEAVSSAVGSDTGLFLDVRMALLSAMNADFVTVHEARMEAARQLQAREAARREAEQRTAALVASINDGVAKLAADSDYYTDYTCPHCGHEGSVASKGDIRCTSCAGEIPKANRHPKESARKVAFEEGSYLGRIDAAFQAAGFTSSGTTMFGKESWGGPAGVTITLENWDPYAMHAIFLIMGGNGEHSDGGSVNFDSPDTQSQINMLVGRAKAMVTRRSAVKTPDSQRTAASDLDDPVNWARYNANNATGSVRRVSGTTINAICDMIEDQSNETVQWARRCAERAGTASVSQLSCADVLTLCNMADAKTINAISSRRTAYSTSAKTASPFDNDLGKVQQAIEAIPGAVITEPDGFTHLNMDVVPQDLADLYQKLMQYGYANGTVAKRKTASGQTCSDCGAAIERDPEGEPNRGWHHNDGATHDHEAQPGSSKTSAIKTAGTLNDRMGFDHVIRVHGDGTVTDEPSIYAPSLYADELDDKRWEFFTTGYSGQDRYSGPIMHDSEYIGGGLERDILASPGVYAAVVNYIDPEAEGDDVDAEGWAVVKLKDSGTTASRRTWTRTRQPISVEGSVRDVTSWSATRGTRDLTVVAANGGFTWAVFAQGQATPSHTGRAATLEAAKTAAWGDDPWDYASPQNFTTTTEGGLRVHTWASTSHIYNDTQTSDPIKDGDVLACPFEGMWGVMVEAWPCAVVFRGSEPPGGLHTATWDAPDMTQYADAVAFCRTKG